MHPDLGAVHWPIKYHRLSGLRSSQSTNTGKDPPIVSLWSFRVVSELAHSRLVIDRPKTPPRTTNHLSSHDDHIHDGTQEERPRCDRIRISHSFPSSCRPSQALEGLQESRRGRPLVRLRLYHLELLLEGDIAAGPHDRHLHGVPGARGWSSSPLLRFGRQICMKRTNEPFAKCVRHKRPDNRCLYSHSTPSSLDSPPRSVSLF